MFGLIARFIANRRAQQEAAPAQQQQTAASRDLGRPAQSQAKGINLNEANANLAMNSQVHGNIKQGCPHCGGGGCASCGCSGCA